MVLSEYKIEIEKILTRITNVLPKLFNNREIAMLAKEILYSSRATVDYLSSVEQEKWGEEFSNLTEAVRSQEARTDGLDTSVEELETKTDSLDTSVETLKTRITDLENNFNNFVASQTNKNLELENLITANTELISENSTNLETLNTEMSNVNSNHIQWSIVIVDMQKLFVEHHSFK